MSRKLKICIEHVIEDFDQTLNPEKLKYEIENSINTPSFPIILWSLGTYAEAEVVCFKLEEDHDVRIP